MFFLFMASPVAYGSSQARGQIGAVAEAYATATTADPSCGCNLHQILDPLSEVRDGACNLMDASQVLNPLSHNRNFRNYFYPHFIEEKPEVQKS